jgi:FkbM family methyltransferase
MRFITDNNNDIIQNCLANGRWFEEDYLKLMKQHCDPGATILDIGANVGSHTVYFSKFMDPRIIYSIEPIPKAYKMLLANIALNYCHNVNVDHVGLALGNQNCIGYPYVIYGKDNLGSTRLIPEPLQRQHEFEAFDPVRVVTGDSLFSNIQVDFIKMDIEGMEMVALEGLRETITRCRPKIFIEVNEENKRDFAAWMAANRYRSVFEDDHPHLHCYYMAIPE